MEIESMLKQIIEQINILTFVTIMKDVSTIEAREDRRLILNADNLDNETVWNLIEKARKGKDKTGTAIEATIARLDRVGFVLLGDSEKPKINPPIWLWTIVDEMWGVLKNWVSCCQDQTSEYFHAGYGYYFKKLAEIKAENRIFAE